MRIETLEYYGADGSINHRDVVRHPGAVVVIPYLCDAKSILLIEQYRIAPDMHLIELPAGKRDIVGEDPVDCARRELEEELGLVAQSMVHLLSFYNTPGFCDEYTHLYLARGLSHGTHSPQGVEESVAQKRSLALIDFEDAVKSGKICDVKTLLGVYALRNYLEQSHGREIFTDSVSISDFTAI